MTQAETPEQHRQARLVEALQQPARYPHPVEHLEVIETHISWVILTGHYAYKIKKPVDLGFLDFRTLEQRRHYCEEELRLNRRLAPELYLDVVPITGSPDAPVLEGEGAPLEYAVRMREFPQEARLDRLLARGALGPEHMDDIAAELARFHDEAPAVDAGRPFGEPEQVRRPVRGNFEQLARLGADTTERERLEALREWSERRFASLRERLAERRAQGFVRECHGDLHLGNMALLDGRITLFDCIEFNESFRWIDVMNEAAFLCMDLDHREHPMLGHRFLNAYLERTGDYAGLDLLPYYETYRALVRAKIAAIRRSQDDLSAAERAEVEADYHALVGLARTYTHEPRPALLITHGLSGSGKTTVTQTLVERLGCLRLRSDVERKRLFGLSAEARTRAALEGGIYSKDASRATYERLAELAETVLRAGYPALVDATFLRRGRRAAFRDLAARLGAAFLIVDVQASDAALEARVAARAAAGTGASEAGLEVLRHQMSAREPLAAEERAAAYVLDTENPPAPERFAREVGARAGLRVQEM